MAERLVQGMDVWINTPRRPWEASGTSGMKVLVNGGLNLSELDGWWAEAYSPEVGWALGDGKEHDSDPSWDDAEAESLYDLLEREVIPTFYSRDERGIPAGWVARMRKSMACLTPLFSANRVVREYTEKHYLPAAAAYEQRSANGGQMGVELLQWQEELARHWSRVRFGSLASETQGDHHTFRIQVYLDDLDPEAVSVELYAEGQNGADPVRQPMQRGEPLVGSANAFLYVANVPATRHAGDYTPRVVPNKAGASVPLEAPFICWRDI
jgi:starch phosphorylase